MKSRLTIFLVLLVVASSWAGDYSIASPGYRYSFPRDHFDHPDYQTEWWYYTGNLKTAEGHRFGFELTFFRQCISRDRSVSPWQVHDLYMAHLALSDVNGNHFFHAERINRAGPGIAGVDAGTGVIWNGNWQVHLEESRHVLSAADRDFGLELNLTPGKPPVIHGRNGISQKAAGVGHASHYISFTRLLTSGSIELSGHKYEVEGTSWMDHEFFTESMNSGENGWDWLSLQFNDNTELMLYRLRHKDGSIDPYSSGSYVDTRGKSIFLMSNDFTMIPTGETWTSPQSKARYPIAWHVSVPSIGLQVDIATPVRTQELATVIGPDYWEGAIDITGERDERPLRGVGYLEMTGYARPNTGDTTRQ